MIPKKIHYCWFGNNEYSTLIKRCIETWNDKLPGWEFILWNEDNSPMEHPFVQKAMRDGKYAFVSDYVRCYALYTYGGVYLDTDMEVLKDIDPLRSLVAFLAPEDISGESLSCGVMGAEKNHKLYSEMLEYYGENLTYTPIPLIISRIIKNKKISISVLPRESFYPYNPFDKAQDVKQLMLSDITNETYAIHHWNFSWKLSFLENIFMRIKKLF
ncbi:glycosyltransferase [Acinetobacter pullicarnis]|uniref:glycosyltransferase n=1 Tax=Acinetobacter pullicarnis TaxID=2576829 RepID=UPI001123812F|nr:glycosyltransferase [Acinetobacter pullicarnis]